MLMIYSVTDQSIEAIVHTSEEAESQIANWHATALFYGARLREFRVIPLQDSGACRLYAMVGADNWIYGWRFTEEEIHEFALEFDEEFNAVELYYTL